MRLMAVLVLTLSQFTVFPFFAMMAANTARQNHVPAHETRMTKQVDLTKGMNVYKSVEM